MTESQPPDQSKLRGVGKGVCAMSLVGSSVTVSHALIAAPLFLAQGIRYAAAMPALILMARFAHAPIHTPRGREWLWLAGIAATGLALFNVAVVRGVAHAEPAAVAVAVACVPVLLGIVGPLLERQSPPRRLLLAAAIVTGGSVIVEGVGKTDASGVLWAAVALACEAAFTLLAMPVLSRHGAWGVSLHSVWMATVILLVLGGLLEGPTAVTRLTPAQWGAISYLAIMVTAVTFVLWYSAVASMGAGRVGLLAGISPIAAAVTGVLGGEVPKPLVWLGILVVIFGLAFGLRSPAVSVPEAEESSVEVRN